MSPMLNIALRAARRAAHLIRRAVGEVRRRDIYEKVANDFVTKTDQAAEAVILDVLRSAYPDHGILAEESGMLEGDAEWLWVVDPLDGTSNFIHGLPHFSVSIACLHEGRMEHAVVLDIMRGEEFTASRGQGTFCGNQRLRVSVCEGLRRALVATGTPTMARQQEYAEQYFACLAELATQASGIRRAGSAALDLAWVAAGRMDAYWEIGLKPWDVAAGALLVQEAGGLISDFMGGENFLQEGNIVCGNLPCFRQLLPIIHRHLKDVPAASMIGTEVKETGKQENTETDEAAAEPLLKPKTRRTSTERPFQTARAKRVEMLEESAQHVYPRAKTARDKGTGGEEDRPAPRRKKPGTFGKSSPPTRRTAKTFRGKGAGETQDRPPPRRKKPGTFGKSSPPARRTAKTFRGKGAGETQDRPPPRRKKPGTFGKSSPPARRTAKTFRGKGAGETQDRPPPRRKKPGTFGKSSPPARRTAKTFRGKEAGETQDRPPPRRKKPGTFGKSSPPARRTAKTFRGKEAGDSQDRPSPRRKKPGTFGKSSTPARRTAKTFRGKGAGGTEGRATAKQRRDGGKGRAGKGERSKAYGAKTRASKRTAGKATASGKKTASAAKTKAGASKKRV